MIQVFVGTNSHMLQERLNTIREEYIKEFGDFGYESVDIGDWELSRVLDHVAALPFLSQKRLVIMRGIAENKQVADSIEKVLEHVSDATDLIIVEGKIDKRSVFYKVVKQLSGFVECNELDIRQLPNWVMHEAKQMGGSIALSDARFLVERVGSNQLLLANELNKLCLYNTAITKQTIMLLTEQAPTSTVFELIDAAFQGQLDRAFALYDDQRAQNVEPLAIEALFVWQLHVVLLVKASGSKSADAIAAASGISPYVVKKSMRLAKQRTFEQLKKYTATLAAEEYALKTQSRDADDAMKNYIALLAVY